MRNITSLLAAIAIASIASANAQEPHLCPPDTKIFLVLGSLGANGLLSVQSIAFGFCAQSQEEAMTAAATIAASMRSDIQRMFRSHPDYATYRRTADKEMRFRPGEMMNAVVSQRFSQARRLLQGYKENHATYALPSEFLSPNLSIRSSHMAMLPFAGCADLKFVTADGCGKPLPKTDATITVRKTNK